MAIVPISSGMPTRANAKNENGPAPASSAASETITLTGLLIRKSSTAGAAGERHRHQELRR